MQFAHANHTLKPMTFTTIHTVQNWFRNNVLSQKKKNKTVRTRDSLLLSLHCSDRCVVVVSVRHTARQTVSGNGWTTTEPIFLFSARMHRAITRGWPFESYIRRHCSLAFMYTMDQWRVSLSLSGGIYMSPSISAGQHAGALLSLSKAHERTQLALSLVSFTLPLALSFFVMVSKWKHTSHARMRRGTCIYMMYIICINV